MHGPEVGFARALHAGGTRNIAIIKVSASIPYVLGKPWPWSKGKKSDSPGHYGKWLSFVKSRLNELEKKGHRYKIAGFVWHQGNDDGINRESEKTYSERLKKLIGDLREEYNCPKAPFILVRSVNSRFATTAAMAPIRAAQVSVAETDDLSAWINVDDLPNINTHHFTAKAQLEIGRRLGEKYLMLTCMKDEEIGFVRKHGIIYFFFFCLLLALS